jgi:RNA recognition motif-containing protein
MGDNTTDLHVLEEESSMRIYVGNLPYSVTRDQLTELFSPFGEVADVHVVTDRQTGRPKGFAFVEMDDAGAQKAISQLNGSMLGDRAITVNEAQPRPERREGSYRDGDGSRQRRW